MDAPAPLEPHTNDMGVQPMTQQLEPVQVSAIQWIVECKHIRVQDGGPRPCNTGNTVRPGTTSITCGGYGCGEPIEITWPR